MPKQPPKSQSEDPAEGSSAASSTTASSPYVASKGPGFDPSKPPENAQQADVDFDGEQLLEEWEEEQVRDWLRNAGDLAHAAFGVGELDLVMTQTDLKRIAPPATRILNRYQPTRAVAQFSDPAAVAMGFGLYGWRSALERIAVLRARKEQEEGKVTSQSTPGAPVVAPAPAPEPADSNGQPLWADQLRATRPQED